MKDRRSKQIQILNLSSICLLGLRSRIAEVALMCVFLTVPVWLFACVFIALTFCLPTMLWKGSSGLHVPSVKEVLEGL